ncbi:MAG: sugar phosphate isomerase/epimerase [Planctomycetes bacterium]|nr:sugar phosphate isomerase/epimerase [Planctomycetota bacterium]
MTDSTRRAFLAKSLSIGAALGAGPWAHALTEAPDPPGAHMSYGLVTYNWGKDWDLATLIRNCAEAKVLGVELRTTHAHGVEPSLNVGQRIEVKKRFADSPVSLVSLGSNERFDHAEPEALKAAVEATKGYVKLGHDVGASGVKVKPNSFPKDIPREKTIEQIGKALNVVGAFAADYGQQIRLEVHGQCSPLPIMKEIMDVADHPNVGVCWNSNAADLEGEGLEHNFNLVKDRFGATAHVRPLDSPEYPYRDLIRLYVKMDYHGWIMLEDGRVPDDRVRRLGEEAVLFEKMVAEVQASL